jgi:hypothetical protein
MKTPVLLILPAVLLAAALAGAGAPRLVPGTRPLAQTEQNSGGPGSPLLQTLIEPGLSVGPLKLGDTLDRALQLFPKKDEDQEWQDQCGATLYWVDTDNRNGRGDLTIHLKKGKVFQIESSTTRFHTAEGITTFDPPEKIKGAYKDLLAFALLTAPTPALGDRPLIFWLDKKNGVAFALAYYPTQHKRYVYKIIVFAPNKTFCPEGEKTDSPKWEQIPPYSLELPSDLAMNRQ